MKLKKKTLCVLRLTEYCKSNIQILSLAEVGSSALRDICLSETLSRAHVIDNTLSLILRVVVQYIEANTVLSSGDYYVIGFLPNHAQSLAYTVPTPPPLKVTAIRKQRLFRAKDFK